jgi:hypothetical protein
MRAPKAPRTPRYQMVKPNYSARTPIVNDSGFTDGPRQPTIGSPQASFNPGQSAAALPNGPPRFINAPGKRVYGGKGMTNKRITNNIL